MANSATPSAYSPPDHQKRWRPRQRGGPVCNYTFDGKRCTKKGAHYCEPRADKPVRFFAELLVHTKGAHARQAFILEPEQEHEIIRPIFGEVIWSPEWRRYVRRYIVAAIVIARKNGKSEIAAGIALYLLIADDEEGAEVYGAAKDTKQAGKVWEPASRMRLLSAVLAKRLGVNKNSRRIFDAAGSSGSYYEVITADALGELGHNPHGFLLDEVLSQPDGSLWEAMRTAAGTRTQPLFLLITTETNDDSSFGAEVIDEAERIQEDPKRNPRQFAYVRKMPRTDQQLETLRRRFPNHPRLPVSLDPWDERNWYWPNPALGSFLSIESLRQEALEAKLEPKKENGFRQFRLNQRVQQATRWMPLRLWDDAGDGRAWSPIPEGELHGRLCYGGLDLAATTDIAALCWLFPNDDDDSARVIWRFWLTEEVLPFLDRHTDGAVSQWARAGYMRITEGDVIDFEDIRDVFEQDLGNFRVAELGYDPWGAPDTVSWLQKRDVTVYPIRQTYEGLSSSMTELMRLTKAHGLDHGGHPVARWMVDAVAVKSPADQPDVIRPIKPNRAASGRRIDGIVAEVMAIAAWKREHEAPPAAADFFTI